MKIETDKTQDMNAVSAADCERNQFPELPWRRGSTLSTVVDHGLLLRKEGRWVIPSFQRPLVWTEQQKIRFIESLILGLPVGEYTLHQTPDYRYEVIDGQQRWEAIFNYVDDQFPVFGLHWHDLNEVSRRGFRHRLFPHHATQGMTEAEKLDAYNRLAYGGTAHILESAARATPTMIAADSSPSESPTPSEEEAKTIQEKK